ncbi:GOLPH3/VPS74 family protein [Stackebrandtia nassauensis]|uniref:GPP34 family phosphoprotein n=1 Tax=Stackebrandtia nassauensis (strain DSM 44728 / CIP 108903 / NRRL B-16338 / NBRC 102104 / LLR-40K-21) TaxID=446470 RepID=D3Q9L4_STANL|nr:GPP34 family phosphoprotein [Stackebrandtia nassauensis]ADD44560.1 hypothetical protein Snas_4919 [Stackebrandtia nassauensis DSM 44728]
MNDRLPVRDELYLLAHNESGKPLIAMPLLGLGLAAALLIELTMSRHVDVDFDKVVTRPQPANFSQRSLSSIANNALSELYRSRNRPPSPVNVLLVWSEDIYERVRGELLAANLVSPITVRRFGLLSGTEYRSDEAAIVRSRTALRRVVMSEASPSAEDAALCGLLVDLQLERSLHLNVNAGWLRQMLKSIGARQPIPIRRIVDALTEAVRYKSTHGTI